jgi:tRNA A37 threonylcarbamoyladenosine synthetase subunit TsaC/SUA5/YrdC
MAELISIHPKDPQHRLVKQAAEMIRDGALAAFPTD